MTFFLQRLAERAMGRRAGARPVRTPFMATYPSSETIFQQGQEDPSAATSHILRSLPEAATPAATLVTGKELSDGVRPVAESPGEEVLAAVQANSVHSVSLDKPVGASVSPISPASYEEILVGKDIHQPGGDGRVDPYKPSTPRLSRYDEQQNPAGLHEVMSQREPTPLPPVVSQESPNPGPSVERDVNPPSRLAEERPLAMRPKGEIITDQRVVNFPGLPVEIEPLLPLSPLSQDVAQQTVLLHASGRDGYDNATEEKTEIHITIGCVEVTELSPQKDARPSKPFPRRRPPMSLDEYLLKRHGRAS